MKGKVLIIDDDNLVGISLKKALSKLDYEIDLCTRGEEAVDKVDQFKPDVILLDIYLTTHNGLDLLKDFQKKYFSVPVIMITGYSDVKIAVSAMKLGAFDFLLKPIDLDQLQFVINKAISNVQLRAEVDKLYTIIREDELPKDFFGKSSKIQKILSSVEKLSKSRDTTLLIQGESGSGKEMFAKYIHQHSPRRDAAFIQINCSTIPKELAESELFGHEKGAFTGAQQKTKLGKFELANGGTILLDEIGELSLDMQVKLLRVLQEKKFYRLGGEKEISVDVRVIAATNRNLEDEIAQGRFREDLYYRLNVANILVPPLRERKEDIPFLAHSFVKEFSQKFNKPIKGISKEASDLLQNYYWKGNIRELRNVMERATLLLEEDELKERHILPLIDSKGSHKSEEDKFVLQIPATGIKIDMVLKQLIVKTLQITGGNQVQAAKILGLSRSKLRYRMEQLGIEITRNFQ